MTVFMAVYILAAGTVLDANAVASLYIDEAWTTMAECEAADMSGYRIFRDKDEYVVMRCVEVSSG